MLKSLLSEQPDLIERVAALSDLLATSRLPSRTKLDAAIATRRSANGRLNGARTDAAAAFRKALPGIDMQFQPPEVRAAEAAVIAADRDLRAAIEAQNAALLEWERSFNEKVGQLLHEAAPTIGEVADMATQIAAALMNYLVFACRNNLSPGASLQEAIAIQEGARAMQAIVSRHG